MICDTFDEVRHFTISSIVNLQQLRMGVGGGGGGERITHKVQTYLQYHNVCPLLGIGTPHHPPLRQASVPLTPEPKGEGGLTRLRVRGWGSHNSNDWRKNLALC
jgi:hypothetical protein